MTAREFAKLEKRLGQIEQAILELAEALRRSDDPLGLKLLPSLPGKMSSDRQSVSRLPRRVINLFRA